MKKELIVMRHAKAARINWDGDDFSRPLTSRGLIDAENQAMALKRLGKAPDLILLSAAARTVETAQIVQKTLGTTIPLEIEENLYLASSNHYMHFVQRVSPDVQRLMLIGHNPGLEYFCNALARDKQNIFLGTSTFVCFEWMGDSWEDLTFNSAEVKLVLDKKG